MVLMDNVQKLNFLIHFGGINKKGDFRHSYWWPYMRRGIAWYVE